jgi:DNA-binding CsgD family transcriptional regulator/tetratricopeptide (TPR) repeat protein
MTMAAPLVGRTRELPLVVDTLLGTGAISLLVMTGEAGIGKSHLLATATEAAVSRGRVVLAGGCLNLREQLPFLPVVDVVRDLAALEDGRLLKAVFAACPAYVRQEITRLAPELDDGDRTDGETDQPVDAWHRQRLFGAVQLLLTTLAELVPVSVTVEDVHWADPSTQDLLRYLASPSHTTAVPLLLTTRAEDLAASWVHELPVSNKTRWLELGPLDEDETAALARAVGDRSDTDLTAIFQRSGGNPLFVQQLAAAGLENGVPTTLTALLLRRLAAVSPIEHELVRALSVAGRPLDDAVLGKLVKRRARAVADGLRSLTAQLIVGSAGPAGHHLRHVLLAEAVYGQMTVTESQQLHRRVAAALADRGDPAAAGLVAEHFAAADDPTAEATWRLRAARYADSVAAPVEASHQWRRVIVLLEHLRDGRSDESMGAPEIYNCAITALRRAGDTPAAASLAEQALARLFAQASPAELVRLHLTAGELRAITDVPAGIALLERAVALGAELAPNADYVSALHQLAQAHNTLSHGDYLWQAELMGRALSVARAAGLQPEEKLLTAGAAWRAMARSDRQQAFQLLDRAANIIPERPDPFVELKVAVYATDIALKFGELQRVLEIGVPSLTAAREQGYQDSFEAGVLLSNVLESLREQGAIDRITAYLGDIEDQMITRESAATHSEIPVLRLAQGDIAAARQLWDDYAEIFVGWDLQFSREFALLRVDFLLWDDRPAEVLPDVLALLEPLCGTDESAMSGGLFVLGLRACADIATRARQIGDAPALAQVLADADRLEQLVHRCRVDPFRPEGVPATTAADHASWQAEWARCHEHDSASGWGIAAAAWTGLGRPHRAAYALWRQADALLADPHRRGRAASVLRAAAHAAEQHVPLCNVIADLARRARIELAGTTAPTPTTPAPGEPFGLTPRERAVIDLVGQGLTNREIGAALYISTKTASVHVSNILLKMGVTSRVHAAALAARTGLLRSTAAD